MRCIVKCFISYACVSCIARCFAASAMVMAAIHLSVPFNSHHCHCRHCAQWALLPVLHTAHIAWHFSQRISQQIEPLHFRTTGEPLTVHFWLRGHCRALCTEQVCTKRCAVLSIKSSPPHLDIGKGGGGRIDEKILRNIWNSHFFLSISSHANLLKAGVSFCRSGSYHSTDQPSVNPSLARCLLWLLIMWHLNVKL